MRFRLGRLGPAFLFIAPVVILLLAFRIYPMFFAIWLSLNDVKLYSLDKLNFVGVQNFIDVFQLEVPEFSRVALNSFFFVMGSVIGQLGFGLGIALLLQQRWVRGAGLLRAFYLLPWVISGIIVAFSWTFIYDPRLGSLNLFLTRLGLEPQSWLAEPHLVLPSLIVMNIWRGMGFSLIMQTSGLQSIPLELYEAGMIDGCNRWKSLRYITLPLLKPFLLLNLIVASALTFNTFDVIFAMTNGGPLFRSEVMPIFMYHQAFDFANVGLGSAVAVILLSINVILTIVYYRIWRQ
ncbi:MAG: carbohydrate ABC transporter permease [Candidatus Bipolaricaulia bacterium]